MVETLQTLPDWQTLRYKAIQDDGSALWPEMWPVERLNQEKATLEAIGKSSIFYREYMCQIVGDADQMFRPEDILEYEGEIKLHEQAGTFDAILEATRIGNERYDDPKRIPVNIFMGVDPASSLSAAADYSTIVPVAIDGEGRRFVLPYFRKRVRPSRCTSSTRRRGACAGT